MYINKVKAQQEPLNNIKNRTHELQVPIVNIRNASLSEIMGYSSPPPPKKAGLEAKFCHELDTKSINFQKIRGLQESKIKLACTQCAVRTMKYLVSRDSKYLELPFLSKNTGQTKEQVVISCNKGDFLSKRNKEIKEIKGGIFDIQSFERSFECHPVGTIAFLFGGVIVEGEGFPIGHALIAYKTEDGIKFLDSTTPEHFDLAFYSPESYFENGFFSLSKQKNAKWMKYFDGLIVSDVGS